jgi:hypothetical protein
LIVIILEVYRNKYLSEQPGAYLFKACTKLRTAFFNFDPGYPKFGITITGLTRVYGTNKEGCASFLNAI